MKQAVEIILFTEALGLDVTGPLGVFSTATELLSRQGKQSEGYEALFSATQPGTIVLDGGMPVLAKQKIGHGPAPDILLVPGGIGVPAFINDFSAITSVREAARRSKRIVSVCNGAFVLAEAGLLDGVRAATHWVVADRFARDYPSVQLERDALYIKEGDIYTSAGVTTGIDLALSIVEDDYGHDLAMQVARMLLVYYRRPGWQSQFSSLLEMQDRVCGRFTHLQQWIQEHLDHRLQVEELAAESGMSPRNFARVFVQETGQTPGKYVEDMRLDRARRLLESGLRDLDHVAEKAGFRRQERLQRAFRRRFGISPRQYQAHFAQNGEEE